MLDSLQSNNGCLSNVVPALKVKHHTSWKSVQFVEGGEWSENPKVSDTIIGRLEGRRQAGTTLP